MLLLQYTYTYRGKVPREGGDAMSWIAGWNIPGYLPDYSEEFDSEEKAQAWLEVCRATYAAELDEGEQDHYVYWVEKA